MKAALAIIFFACIAGSMASDARLAILDELVQQGTAVAQSIFGQLQSQILGIVQNLLGSLLGSVGRFDFLNVLMDQFKPLLTQLASQALGSVLGSLTSLIGGAARIDIGAIFQGFLDSVKPAITGIAQQLLNQGLVSVLGSLGGLGGRGIGDLFAGLQQHISTLVGAAQGALSGALGNLSALGSTLLDASKPHWEQLQEQLVGHGLNVLGSLSETINNLHGSITSGR